MASHRLVSLLVFLSITNALPLLNRATSIPSFVLNYAPVVWLQSAETYFPSDIGSHLVHTHPDIDTTAITPAPALSLSNLNILNSYGSGGTDVYLTSNEGIQALPSWFNGVKPTADGSIGNARGSAIITVAKPNNVLDAFYFFFYAYNQGDWVFNTPSLEFGDHVGDWEHTMIRFVNEMPQAIWYSQHSSGEAFTYATVEKDSGIRPVVYSANGTHANYATSGIHDHTIPNFNLPVGPLEDHTDKGTRWDPILNAYTYSYDITTNTFVPYNGQDPIEWLEFSGNWGDAQLPDSTPGQIDIFGEAKYVGGPTGPADKDLARSAVCPDGDACIIRPILTP